MFNSRAGGAEFKSVHLHELPTYDNLAKVSLGKKNTATQLWLIYYASTVWLVLWTTNQLVMWEFSTKDSHDSINWSIDLPAVTASDITRQQGQYCVTAVPNRSVQNVELKAATTQLEEQQLWFLVWTPTRLGSHFPSLPAVK